MSGVTSTHVMLPPSSRYKDTSVVSPTSVDLLEWGLWISDINIMDPVAYNTHVVKDSDIGRLDRIAYQFYGNSHYWWMIAAANKMIDPIGDMKVNDEIKIPSRTLVEQFVARRPVQ